MVSCKESCLTLCDPMDCSPPGSSVHGILQQEHCSGSPFPSPGDLPNPGIKPGLLHCRRILYCLSHRNIEGSNLLADHEISVASYNRSFFSPQWNRILQKSKEAAEGRSSSNSKHGSKTLASTRVCMCGAPALPPSSERQEPHFNVRNFSTYKVVEENEILQVLRKSTSKTSLKLLPVAYHTSTKNNQLKLFFEKPHI